MTTNTNDTALIEAAKDHLRRWGYMHLDEREDKRELDDLAGEMVRFASEHTSHLQQQVEGLQDALVETGGGFPFPKKVWEVIGECRAAQRKRETEGESNDG